MNLEVFGIELCFYEILLYSSFSFQVSGQNLKVETSLSVLTVQGVVKVCTWKKYKLLVLSVANFVRFKMQFLFYALGSYHMSIYIVCRVRC